MTPERRALIAIGGSVFVAVMVTVIIVAFGVIPLPKFASLDDQPDSSIPGTIAYIVANENSCLFTVPAGGGNEKEVWCSRSFVESPEWTADGRVVLTDWSDTPSFVVIDVGSGDAIERIPIGDRPVPDTFGERRTRIDGAIVSTDGVGNGKSEVTVSLPDDSIQTILSVADAPDDYYFDQVQWSPDGAWVLVIDNAGRLMIVGADGTPEARILVEDVDGWGAQVAWYIADNDTYTITLPR